MAKIYANKVMLGVLTIDQVPEKLRSQVLAILEEKGWVTE